MTSIGEPFAIPGARGFWQQIDVTYDYSAAPGTCPHCGGVGMPWRGLFHCDGTCHGIAVVADGRFFVPVALEAIIVDEHTYAWEP